MVGRSVENHGAKAHTLRNGHIHVHHDLIARIGSVEDLVELLENARSRAATGLVAYAVKSARCKIAVGEGCQVLSCKGEIYGGLAGSADLALCVDLCNVRIVVIRIGEHLVVLDLHQVAGVIIRSGAEHPVFRAHILVRENENGGKIGNYGGVQRVGLAVCADRCGGGGVRKILRSLAGIKIHRGDQAREAVLRGAVVVYNEGFGSRISVQRLSIHHVLMRVSILVGRHRNDIVEITVGEEIGIYGVRIGIARSAGGNRKRQAKLRGAVTCINKGAVLKAVVFGSVVRKIQVNGGGIGGHEGGVPVVHVTVSVIQED